MWIYTNEPNGANDKDTFVDVNEDDTTAEVDNKSDENDDNDDSNSFKIVPTMNEDSLTFS